VQVPGSFSTVSEGDTNIYSLPGADISGISPGDWLVMGDERKEVAGLGPLRVKDRNFKTRSGSLYVVRPGDIFRADDLKGNQRFLITAEGNVGIGNGVTTPSVKLAVGGNGADIYATDIWVERNMHVQGNETLAQGSRGRLRVGTAWGYIGIYADPSSTGANDLVLGASSSLVRVGPPGGGQNLAVSGDVNAGKIVIGDWTLEARVDGGWGSPRSALFISYQGMDVARFGTYQDMLQIKRFSNATGKPTGSYFYVNVGGPGNT